MRHRLEAMHPSNWETWPAIRGLWPWFAALGVILMVAIPWGIRAEERHLESASREALAEEGLLIEDISFTGRQATITANLTPADQNAAVAALVELGGVAGVTWEEGSDRFVAPTTTTVPPTTMAPEPGAELTTSVKGGRITLRGIVPAAQIIRDVADAAADLWGSDLANQLFVDTTVIAHPWLGAADDAVAVLTMLIDPQLTLDAEGATITGGAIDQNTLDLAIERLGIVLGPDIAIDNKVTVTPLDLPAFEIIAPGDGTVAVSGTVANREVRRSIIRAVVATAEELEVDNQLRIGDTTADVYMLRRIPEVIAALGGADQWTLRFDGESLGGTATGGKAFSGNRIQPTAQVADLVALVGGFLRADPHLVLEIEIHAEVRPEGVAASELAQERAEAIVAHLVRLGIDPDRVTATRAAGDGELLRFSLIPADQ